MAFGALAGQELPPHVRGKAGSRPVQMAVPGSPPHVQGEVLTGEEVLPHIGITPACAGRSPAGGAPGNRRRDHPRMCGEKSYHLGTGQVA